MYPWHTTALFIVAVLNALFSLILIRGARDRVNIVFSLFVLSAATWALGIAMFIIVDNVDQAIYIANFYYASAALIVLLFLYFSLVFLRGERRVTKYYFLASIPAIVLISGLILDKNLIISSITKIDGAKDVVINFTAYSIYGLFFIVYVIIAFYILFLSLRSTTAKEERLQLKFV